MNKEPISEKRTPAFPIHKKTKYNLLWILLAVLLILLLYFRFNPTTRYICINDGNTLYLVDHNSQEIVWEHSEETIAYHCVSENTVYVALPGIIYALTLDSGEKLWETNCSVEWAPNGKMQYADGKLYYTGTYDTRSRLFGIYSLDLSTKEETQLDLSHSQLSNFSVVGTTLFTYDGYNVQSQDMTTGTIKIAGNLEDIEYNSVSFLNDKITIKYRDYADWYSIENNTTIQKELTIPSSVFNLNAFSVCDMDDSRLVFTDRNPWDLHLTGKLYLYNTKSEKLILLDESKYMPREICFIENGFYAAWTDQTITYYKANGKAIQIA